MASKKDWKNNEKRRDEALRHGATPNSHNGVDGDFAWNRPYTVSVVSVPPGSVAASHYDNRAFQYGDYDTYGRPGQAHEYDAYAHPAHAHNYGAYANPAQAHNYNTHVHNAQAHDNNLYGQPYGYPPHSIRSENFYDQNPYSSQQNVSRGSPGSHDSYDSSPDDGSVYELSPIEKRRKCRDVICLAFFTAAIVLTIVIGSYAFMNGDLRRFTNGVDLNCDICGVDNNAKMGVANSGKDLRNSNFLVTQKSQRRKQQLNFRFPPDELQLDDFNFKVKESHIGLRQCQTKCPSESKIILNRCVSRRNVRFDENRTARINVEALTLDDITDAVDDVTTLIEEITEDIESSWIDVLFICLVSLGVAIFVTILLRIFAGIIIWIIVGAISLTAIGGTIALWLLWWSQSTAYSQGQGSWTSTEVTALLVSAILVSILTLLLLVILFFMRKRISLLIKLFNVAGKAVHALPFILFQPLVTFLALGVAFSVWLLLLLLIETSGNAVIGGQPNATIPTCHYEASTIMIFARWWNLFMIIWMAQFILGCQHLVIAGAVSIWYFTRDKTRLGFPVMLSYQHLVRYHLGSVAFGSLVIAIVKMIRYILHTIQKQLGENNAFCRAILCCFQCFTWCLEKFLNFLSENAYIEIAIYGYGFCKSARKAFSVISNNALRLATINSIGGFVLFLAKLTIVALTVFIGYEMIINKGNVTHIWVPLTLGGIFSYFVAHCFISVYEMTIDTVFVCFCEDCELNDGRQKPYYMSKGLMEFVKNTEKELAQEDKDA